MLDVHKNDVIKKFESEHKIKFVEDEDNDRPNNFANAFIDLIREMNRVNKKEASK
jgi:hypothetical protein